MLRNSRLLPLDVTDKDWLIQSKISFEESQQHKRMGRWSLPVPKKNLNETWKLAKKSYKTDQLGLCRYLMCSTNSDSEQKSGVIMFFFDGSKQEEVIKSNGEQLVRKLSYKPPDGVSTIYYKSKTLNPEKKYLYKLELEQDDSDSD